MTDSGRTVYGGAGIAPDESSPRPPTTSSRSNCPEAFETSSASFIPKYFATRDAKLSKGWSPDATMLKEFASSSSRPAPVHRPRVAGEPRMAEVSSSASPDHRLRLDEIAAVRHRNRPVVLKAIEALPKARLARQRQEADGSIGQEVQPRLTSEPGPPPQVVVLDTGGQYCHLISPKSPRTRRLCRIRPATRPPPLCLKAPGDHHFRRAGQRL
jgi:hypothetical protein